MTMRLRRKPRPCKATMGTTVWLDGKAYFPCELPDGGHEWHERTSPPVAARWREMPGGGREYEAAEGCNTVIRTF